MVLHNSCYVFEKASLVGWHQTSEKESDADKLDQDLLGAGEPFIVFT
jgi:hypothetical protein